ncbi:MAG: hypothetical protein ACO1NQ_03990 [Flavobacteriales bacterium]
METSALTPELLQELTDERHLRVVHEKDHAPVDACAAEARELDELRDVLYRLWNAEHQRRA